MCLFKKTSISTIFFFDFFKKKIKVFKNKKFLNVKQQLKKKKFLLKK